MDLILTPSCVLASSTSDTRLNTETSDTCIPPMDWTVDRSNSKVLLFEGNRLQPVVPVMTRAQALRIALQTNLLLVANASFFTTIDSDPLATSLVMTVIEQPAACPSDVIYFTIRFIPMGG